jgi:hypothetical protein
MSGSESLVIGVCVVLVALYGAYIYFGDSKAKQLTVKPTNAGGGNSLHHSAGLNAAASHNMDYLATIRHGSCYHAARDLHTLLTNLAYFITALSVFGAFLVANRLNDLLVFVVACVAAILVAVVITIERAIFTALIDTADVVIDMGRQARKANGEV